ncbi:DHH family phosphoesterase [Clostridium botulinum]|uniref:1-pyrroline-5-carboxylate dehydrogenase n=2 Tax=Clostridium botulinum TaxID=1491 RepID=A0A9Q1V0E7_CLOBO|nr:bifunctional oligoribonuclease/PAP phosphatase NrnA [Clostridium botulinum]AEB76121.1 exopolyphosphatase family protein [Clostridium botulinum BKT015925]KEH97814.1 1-pyrroline-5-carboxylate dehydrogenase [Clostridium botulinum D str. 16868]KEI05506.1 1-pyrroline-5-carboxylate dehydrogenase [Clostridium botulinum C/D str. Sp77]KLU76590.1 1-pyrroline-5-carboxylate dehydrogenase [Clostridium botulinum V891]KOA75975.1 1-pyrroline-5-carboxylate dehydrogenase [Clostridium botulinum]
MIIDSIITSIKESKKIGITCHVSPDGDSIGSSLALMQGLLKLGKETYVISKEDLPETFRFLPYSKEISASIGEVLPNTDMVIVVDCGNVERINFYDDINARNYKLINIDHHLSNDYYGDFNYVDSKAAAVAEIIYELLNLLQVPLDKNICSCLYTSLITDTGSFRHSNTTKRTHEIAGNLISYGIDFSQIHRTIFENMQFNNLKLHGKIIENMYMKLNDKVCIMNLTQSMLEEFDVEKGDTSDVINIGTKIGSVEVAILFKEADNGTKVSLRSKNIVDVRRIAELFNGGGHIRAAGFFSDKKLQEIKEILLREIEKELI